MSDPNKVGMHSPGRKRFTLRTWLILAGGAGLLVMIIVVAVRSSHPAPSYNGRPLSAWVRELTQPTFYGGPGRSPALLQYGTGQRSHMEAVEAVRSMGPQAVPSLLEMFSAKGFPFEARIADWLRRHPWIGLRLDPAPFKRQKALSALVRLKGHIEPPIELLASLLTSTEPEIRRHSLQLLWHYGSDNDAVIQGAVRCLIDPDPAVASWAAYLLHRLSPDPAKFSEFAAIFDAELNRGVQPAIGTSTIPLSIRELKHWPDRVLFADSTPQAKAPARLSLLVKDAPRPIRVYAARALGFIGPDAKSAIPILLSALTDQDDDLRVAAAEALGAIGGLDHWIDLLSSGSSTEQESAALILGYMEGGAVPALITALQNEQMEVRATAAAALGRLGDKTIPAVQALEQALQDPEPWVRRKAAAALRKLTNESEIRE